ncbi:MAG: hypothetical protein AB1500_12410 [Bacillota bacterium]
MKKLGFICLILLVALGIMGTGYARWSDTVTAAVYTDLGDLNVGMMYLQVNDLGCDPTYYCRYCPQSCSDIGSITCGNGGEARFELNGSAYYQNVNFTISKGYHGYAPMFSAQVANGGSIPTKIEDIMLEWQSIAWDGCGDFTPPEVWKWTIAYPGGGAEGYSFESLQSDIRNITLDPGQTMQIELYLRCGSGWPVFLWPLLTCSDNITQGTLEITEWQCWNGMW